MASKGGMKSGSGAFRRGTLSATDAPKPERTVMFVDETPRLGYVMGPGLTRAQWEGRDPEYKAVKGDRR